MTDILVWIGLIAVSVIIALLFQALVMWLHKFIDLDEGV